MEPQFGCASYGVGDSPLSMAVGKLAKFISQARLNENESGITHLTVSVICRSLSECSVVCLLFLYLSVIAHTGLLNDGPMRFTGEDI